MKIKYSVLALVCGLTFVGCTQNFEETNTNPNKITVKSGKLSASAMFEKNLYDGTNYLTYISWFWNDELVQHTACTGNTVRNEHRYNIGDANWASLWDHIAGYASNINEMNRLAKLQKDIAMQAVSKTMFVMFMQNLTDMFGDIPYREAFMAEQGNLAPAFDSQEEVYKQMCADLEQANKLYASNPYVNSNYAALDNMYGFNMKKWQRFNNSLYIRVLGRLMGRNATVVDSTNNMTVKEKLQQIIDNPAQYPVFTSNDDNATVRFTAVAPYYSEFDPANYTESDFTYSSYHLSEQTIKMMVIKGLNADGSINMKADVYVDPRLHIIGKQRESTPYWKGTVAGGLAENQGNDDRASSYLNTEVLRRNNADGFLMGFDELQFILAEAALKGVINGGDAAARTYYEAGITANMQKWSKFAQAAVPVNTPVDYIITDQAIADYLQSPLASWDINTNHEELILNQKYIATFWVGMEGWNDYRRTGYPELTIGQGTDPNDFVLPTRMGYPNTTTATNAAHVAEALKRMKANANDMKTPLWWSKKAIEGGL